MELIGQQKLINKIDILIKNGFPRFTILTGARGVGKKFIAENISRRLKAILVTSEIKVEDVRNIINLAYKVSVPTVYLLPDCEKMHNSAKNALLKVTEEPPSKAYFIFTVSQPANLLNTLLSRACVLNMDNYNRQEKLLYIQKKYFNKNGNTQDAEIAENIDFVLDVCDTFLEIDLFISYGIKEFRQYCELTASNLQSANLANAFKINQKLKFKDEDEGFDPSLFLKTLADIYMVEHRKNPSYSSCEKIACTLNYAAELNITGVNKSATIDSWILEMREF